jgi:hypothetical protein
MINSAPLIPEWPEARLTRHHVVQGARSPAPSPVSGGRLDDVRISSNRGLGTVGRLSRADMESSQRSTIDRAHKLLRTLHLRCALVRQGHDHRRRPNGLRTMHGKTTGSATSLISFGLIAQRLTRAASCAGRLLPQHPRRAEWQRKSRSAADAKRLGGGDEVPGCCFPFFTSPPRTDVTAPYRSYRPVMPYTSDFVVFAPTPSENRPACTGWSSTRPKSWLCSGFPYGLS